MVAATGGRALAWRWPRVVAVVAARRTPRERAGRRRRRRRLPRRARPAGARRAAQRPTWPRWPTAGSTRPRWRRPTWPAGSCCTTSGRSAASTASTRRRTCGRGTTATPPTGSWSLGVHTPEFAYEADPANVAAAVAERAHRPTRWRSIPKGGCGGRSTTTTGRRSSCTTAMVPAATPTSARAPTPRPRTPSARCSASTRPRRAPRGGRAAVIVALAGPVRRRRWRRSSRPCVLPLVPGFLGMVSGRGRPVFDRACGAPRCSSPGSRSCSWRSAWRPAPWAGAGAPRRGPVARVGGVLLVVFGLVMAGPGWPPVAGGRALRPVLPAGAVARPWCSASCSASPWTPCVGPLSAPRSWPRAAPARPGGAARCSARSPPGSAPRSWPWRPVWRGRPGLHRRLRRISPALGRVAAAFLVVLGIVVASGHLGEVVALRP